MSFTITMQQMYLTVLDKAATFDKLDLASTKQYTCVREDIIIYLNHNGISTSRQVAVRDMERGILIVINVRHDTIKDYLLRFGIDESVTWWSLDDTTQPSYSEAINSAESSHSVPPRGRQNRVYFIHNAERNIIKIGITRSPDQRLRSLQTASPDPLIMLGHIEGGRDIEAEFHERFAEYRCYGEWFTLTEQIKQEVIGLLNISDW